MDKKNLLWATILAVAMAVSNVTTLVLGKEHMASQVMEMVAKTACMLDDEVSE